MASTLISMAFCACCGEWLKECRCPAGPIGDPFKAEERRKGCRHPKWEKELRAARKELEKLGEVIS